MPDIVLDGVFFQFRDPSGIARVWSALLEAWAGTRFGDSLLILDRDGAVPKFPALHYVPWHQYESRRAADESFALQDLCSRENARLFVSTFYTTPLETVSVAMVHDLIPERIGGCEPKWCIEKRLTAYHASGYIAVSHNTAKDLYEEYPSSSSAPLCVAHNGVGSQFHPMPVDLVESFKRRYQINKPYFLCVGKRDGYKNVRLLFEAFSRLAGNEALAIVCLGGRPDLERELHNLVDGSAVYTLRPSDEEMCAAYSGALALVYPSLYEGFGLPILEAMAAGCPVITTQNASIPEVAGEAALYVEGCDVDGMVRALQDVQKADVRENLIRAGFKRSEQFSWRNTAEVIASFLTEMTRGRCSLPETERPMSNKRWREIRAFHRDCEAMPDRVRALLGRPELKSHMPTIGTAAQSEEEKTWLQAIASGL